MFPVGTIVVVNQNAPARFKNLKLGTIWKVIKKGADGLTVTVGDKNHPAGISTNGYNLTPVPQGVLAQFCQEGLEGTDLAIRLHAIQDFRDDLGTPAMAGEVGITHEDATVNIGRSLATLFAAKNGGKVIQKKLARALGRV